MNSWQARTQMGYDFLSIAAQAPAKVLIATDFDGTLAPIIDDPELSRMLPEAARALESLGECVGQLAIITGRSQETVRRLGALEGRPGLGRLIVCGSYGSQRWDAATGEVSQEQFAVDLAEVHRRAAEIVTDSGAPEVHLEDKQTALGVHTRRSPDPDLAFQQLHEPMSALAEELGLQFEPGRHVLELRASTRTKGDALRELAQETGATAVAMCGDDLGDLPAFEALAQLRAEGIATCAVVAGSEERPELSAQADVLAEGPPGVATWLRTLAVRIRAGR